MKVVDEMFLYLHVKHKVSVLAGWLVGPVEMLEKITGSGLRRSRVLQGGICVVFVLIQ